MSRVATGAITITDIADGGSPISAFLTNENHTFAASNLGAVTSAERSNFSTTVGLFVGFAIGIYKHTAVAAVVGDYNKFNYTLASISSSSAGWTWAIDSTTGAITIAAIPGGTSNKSTVITIPIVVNDSSTTLKNVTLSLTLNKSIEGTGGAVIQLSATKQYFQYDEFANLAPAVQADVTINRDTQGIVGTLTAQKSVDGAGFTTLVQGTGADEAKLLDIDGAGAADSVVISTANFHDSNTLTIKISGSTGGSDSVSLVRVRDGIRGASGLYVNVTSNDGNVFKNGTGTDKTITCTIFDMIDGTGITHAGTGTGQTSVVYNWQRVDAGGTSADVFVNSGTRDVTPFVSSGATPSADGAGAATLIIGHTDIADNSSTQFSCTVTITDN